MNTENELRPDELLGSYVHFTFLPNSCIFTRSRLTLKHLTKPGLIRLIVLVFL